MPANVHVGVISAPPELIAPFTRTGSSDGKHKDRFRAEIERGGYKPSYTKPTIFHMGGSIASVMMNHEYGVRPVMPLRSLPQRSERETN